MIKCKKCNREIITSEKAIKDGYKKYGEHLCRSCKMKLQYENGTRISKGWNWYNTGESLEKKHGIKKAEQIRQKISQNTSGKNNPNFGGKYSHGFADRHPFRGKTFEEYYGEEKAKQLKKTYSDNAKGKNNPMYGKPSPQGSGNGWSGWYNNWYFRSLRELSYMINVIEKENLKWESAEQKKYKIPYIDYNGDDRNYFADFVIDNAIIEIKPKKLVESYQVQLKKEHAEKWCKEKKYAYMIVDDTQFDLLSSEEIQELRETNKIIFGDKYEQLYQTRFGKIKK